MKEDAQEARKLPLRLPVRTTGLSESYIPKSAHTKASAAREAAAK